MMAVVSGVVCILAGVLRLGFVTELLSKPIRYGYMNGIALTVLISQLPKVFGFSVESDGPLRNVWRIALRHYARAVAGLDGDPRIEDKLDFHVAFARLDRARLARLKRDLDKLLTAALGDGGEGGERVLAVAVLTPVM